MKEEKQIKSLIKTLERANKQQGQDKDRNFVIKILRWVLEEEDGIFQNNH